MYKTSIDMEIEDLINEKHIPSQIPGDFLLDINSFASFDGEFAVQRVNDENNDSDWIMEADHDEIMKRLVEWDGILRLRLGKMLFFKMEDCIVRIWNFLDGNKKNMLDWRISNLGSQVPYHIKNILAESNWKRLQMEERQAINIPPRLQSRGRTEVGNEFSLERAFGPESDGWSPTPIEVLTPLHVVEEPVDMNNIDWNSLDLDISTIPKRRDTPSVGKARTKTKRPKLSDLAATQ